jgi:hypothetical protein
VCLADLEDQRAQRRRREPAGNLLFQDAAPDGDGSIIFAVATPALARDHQQQAQVAGMGADDEIHQRRMRLRQGHPVQIDARLGFHLAPDHPAMRCLLHPNGRLRDTVRHIVARLRGGRRGHCVADLEGSNGFRRDRIALALVC